MRTTTREAISRRGIGTTTLLALFATWAGSGSLALAAEGDAHAITFRDGERIYISQCGLNAATFLLEYFERDYNLQRVATELRPAADGIALGPLQRVLQVHGLQAEARQEICLEELRGPLKSGALAVLPIKSGPQAESRHYVIAMYDPQQGYLLIDVPRQVAPLFENLDDARLSEPVALFVSRPVSAGTAQQAHVIVEPAQLQLGRFDLDAADGQNPVESTFAVINQGKTAVHVALEVSCSCMKLDWTGGILAPDEERQVTLNVWPGQWGLGPTKHPIYVTLGDQSELTVSVEAEGVASAPYSFALAQRSFTINCSRLTDEPVTVERTVEVTFVGAAQDHFEVETTEEWLTATQRLIDEQRGQVVLTARLNRRMFEERSQLEGQALVRGYARKPAQSVNVRLVRHDFFAMENSTAVVTRTGDGSVPVVIRPVEGLSQRVTWHEAVPDRPGLLQETSTRADGSAVLEISRESAPGHYMVRCELLSDVGERGTTYVIITVEE